MASEGPNSPDSGTDDDTVGTTIWTLPIRVIIEDNVWAACECGFEP